MVFDVPGRRGLTTSLACLSARRRGRASVGGSIQFFGELARDVRDVVFEALGRRPRSDHPRLRAVGNQRHEESVILCSFLVFFFRALVPLAGRSSGPSRLAGARSSSFLCSVVRGKGHERLQHVPEEQRDRREQRQRRRHVLVRAVVVHHRRRVVEDRPAGEEDHQAGEEQPHAPAEQDARDDHAERDQAPTFSMPPRKEKSRPLVNATSVSPPNSRPVIIPADGITSGEPNRAAM